MPNRTSRQAIWRSEKRGEKRSKRGEKSPQSFHYILKIITITRGQTYLWTDYQSAAKCLIRSCLTFSCLFPSLKEYQRMVDGLSFELRNFYTNNIPHHITESTFHKSLAASSPIFGGSLAHFRTVSFLFLEEVLRKKCEFETNSAHELSHKMWCFRLAVENRKGFGKRLLVFKGP